MTDEQVIRQFRGKDVWRDADGTIWVRQQQLIEAWEQGYDAGLRLTYPRRNPYRRNPYRTEPDWVDDAAPLPRPDGSSDA